MLNCVMCYTGISAAASSLAWPRMERRPPQPLPEQFTGLVCAGRPGALQRRPTSDLDIGAYSSRRLV
jgi:hypothetical protein